MMEYKGIELEQIKEKIIIPDGRDMLVWDDNTTPTIKKVYAIINRGDYYFNVITTTDEYQYAAEIPKPQTREMNSLEVMEYLHLFQLWLDGVTTMDATKKRCKAFEFPELEKGLIDVRYSPIVLKDNENKGWCDKAILMEFDDVNTFKFGILKNGNVTEFELPKIEA